MHPDITHTTAASHFDADSVDKQLNAGVRVAILCAFAAMAVMIWTRNINWDEFYFLSHVHANLNGHLDRPLQTVFVHAFGWLTYVSDNEIGQIAAARCVMLACFATTCFAIHRIAQMLADTAAADIAVLAFVTSGFAIAHGGSFRADPIAASLLITAVAIIMTSRMGWLQIIGVAVLSAFALLVTIKSALYLPVYIAALWWRWDDRAVVLRCLLAGIIALAIAAALFAWHAAGITPAEGASAGQNIGEAASVTLGGSGFLPRWPELSLWLMFSLGSVILTLASLWFAPSHKTRVVLILCAIPLLSVVIYRNAFPYFFPFAVAPLIAMLAIGAAQIRGSIFAKMALVLMLASGAMQTQRAFTEGNTAQRATLAEVHRLFPSAVPYIDQNGMVSSFQRLGFFMSTWGLAGYRNAGQPVMADLIASQQPPLLLANRGALHAALNPGAENASNIGLLPQDIASLRASFVHHAGAIWIAGQDVTLADGPNSAQVPFKGAYRVETDHDLLIDGMDISDGAVLSLNGGPVTISGPANTQVRLIWNTAATGPAPVLPETGLYSGFWRL